MKIICIGDIHGRSIWKQIVEKEDADKVIFLGDYFDSWDVPGIDQIHNFKEIIEYKETAFTNDHKKVNVVLLIGNHDHHYFPEVGPSNTSGYQNRIAPNITQVIDENRNHLQMAYQMNEFLFTHAGVSSVFMDQVFGAGGWKVENLAIDLNELFKYKPKSFEFGSYPLINKMSYLDPYGDSEDQSSIWIRPRALMRANRDTLRKQVIQVVGHTQQEQIDKKGGATGGRYYFIDTLGTSGEYLVINDGEITISKI